MTLNKKRGFLRLTIVLSILTGIGYFIYMGMMGELFTRADIIIVIIFGAAPIRMIYLFIRFVILGFIVKGFKK